MIDLLRRLGRSGAPPGLPPEPAVPAAPDAIVPLEVEFAAYAEDSRLYGFFRPAAERLSDALNQAEEVRLTDVLLVALSDGRTSETRELTVMRREILVVRATGPRGNPVRRNRTRPYPVTLQTGPYTVHGHLHALPGADPIVQLRRRQPMVPLTEAWIEYRSAGAQHRARVGTVIVNRELLDWVRPSRDDELGLPDLPMETAPDPLAKDLTGYLYTSGPVDTARAR